MNSASMQYLIALGMAVSIILLIVIPYAVVDERESDNTSVLILGDSQCENMKQYFADTLHEELTLNLKMRGLLRRGGVNMKMDCRSWRRLAECLPVHKHCSNAKALLPKYCKGKQYDVVVPFLGVNNIDWNSTIYGEPGAHWDERKNRTIQEVDEMVATAATACPGSQVLVASPMNIANCGWGWGHLGDTCMGFDGITQHPFFLSHWLGEQMAAAADLFPSVTFFNTSGLEDTSLYYDATHTDDPKVAKNMAMGIANAISVQVQAQQMRFSLSMTWEHALSQAQRMFTRDEAVAFSEDPQNSVNIPQGKLDYKRPRLVDAFHEPSWEVLCESSGNGTNTLNQTLGGAVNASGSSDSEAACGKIELKEFLAIVGIFLIPLLFFEGLAFLALDDENNLTTPPADPLPRMMPALEGIRIIGAFHILVFHLYQKFEWSNFTSETCQFCGFGKYWVQVFFMLTGFVSYRSCSREGGPDGFTLARRRVVGLYPLYFIACMMGYLVTLLQTNAASADEVFRTLLLNQTWWPPFHYGGLSGPGWFLSCLFVFWIALPHWARALRRGALWKVVMLVTISYLASWMAHLSCYEILDFPLRGRWYVLAVHNFIEFSPYANWYNVAFGLGLAALIERWPSDALKRTIRLCGASSSIIGIMVFFLLARSPGFTMGTHELLIDKGPLSLPVVAILMIACTDSKDPMARFALSFIGRAAPLAWPIYILHVPVSQLLKQILEEEDYPIAFNVFIQPAVLLLAACLGAKFHTNWNALFAGITKRRKQRAAIRSNAGSSGKKNNKAAPIEVGSANGNAAVELVGVPTAPNNRVDSPASDVSRKGSDDVTRQLIGSRLKSDDSPETTPHSSRVGISRPGDAPRI